MFAKTITDLAEQIGCARETLSRWKSADKSFPKAQRKGYDVEAVREWILDNDKMNSPNATTRDKELYNLKCMLAKQDIERNDLELAEMRKELVKFEEAREICLKALSPIARRLKDLPASMCGKCNPSDPTFAKHALRTWTDETLKLINTQAERLKK